MDEGYKTQFVNNLPILLPIGVSTLLYIKKIIKKIPAGQAHLKPTTHSSMHIVTQHRDCHFARSFDNKYRKAKL